MKKTSFFCSLFVAILFATVSLQSCTSSSNSDSEETIVDEYVEFLNKTTGEIKACKSIEEFHNLNHKTENDAQKYKNSDYKLSDRDRKEILDAVIDLTVASLNKSYQLNNIDMEITPEMKDQAREAAKKELEKCETLGDIWKNL